MGLPIATLVRAGLGDVATAHAMAKALTRSGWLREYRVFEELRIREGNDEDTEGNRPPPYRDKSGRPRTRTRRLGI